MTQTRLAPLTPFAHLRMLFQDLGEEIRDLGRFDRFFLLFWLAGPFLLLIERSPADLWVSLIALGYIVHLIKHKDFRFLSYWWVRVSIVFLGMCLVSAMASDLVSYSVTETLIWFRFPIFAMAVCFWLGVTHTRIMVMLVMIGAGMVIMDGILFAEMIVIGQIDGRLSWPYGDLVPGNYLSKAALPAFLALLYFGIQKRGWVSASCLLICAMTILASFFTGERLNLIILLASSVMMITLFRRQLILPLIGCVGVMVALYSGLGLSIDFTRHIDSFIAQLPTSPDSIYYRAFAPGVLAFLDSPLWGVGPANLRDLCAELTMGVSFADCHPHPHNFYLQLLGETGLIGFVVGSLLFAQLIYAANQNSLRLRFETVFGVMFIVPFAFFWPFASMPDLFGQWNNCFMWSSLAFCLAAAHHNHEQTNLRT